MPTLTNFALVEQCPVPELDATASRYIHAASGAEHVHLSTHEPERAFLVAFPTLPDSSDGRAHVLEHMVLSGSQRFPVQDMFFTMMRRSVATTMNAMTYADRTVYPFATTDAQDYENLLAVYLDATFFPRLERASFLREGWRIERGRAPGDAPAYQGVVLNEMKGACANPLHIARSALMAELFAGTTYAQNAGGEPLQIPSLTHDALCAFHRTHYHPSQALFMTAGPVDPAACQRTIEQRVLAVLQAAPQPRLQPPLAAAWTAPRRLTVSVPGEGANGHALQIAWRLHDSADADRTLRLRLLVNLLIGHAGAPLRRAIDSAGFGHGGWLQGLDAGPRQVVLHLGMAGLRADQVHAAEALILGTLQQLAAAGLPEETVQAGLRDLRFAERQEAVGLERLMVAAQDLLRGLPLAGAFSGEQALARLEPVALQGHFVQQAVRELLDAREQLVAHLVPTHDFFAQREQAEQSALALCMAGLDAAALARMAHDNAQSQPTLEGVRADDSLPRVRRADLTRDPRVLPPLTAGPAVSHEMPTSGLSHVQLCVDLSDTPRKDWSWLHLYAGLLPMLGAAGREAADALRWRDRLVPAFGVALGAPAAFADAQWLSLAFSCSTLREQRAASLDIIDAWLNQPTLADDAHIVRRLRSGVQARVASLVFGAGALGELALVDSLAPAGAFRQAVEGLPSLGFLRHLRQLLDAPDGPAHIVAQLRRMHARVLAGPRQFLSGGQHDEGHALLHCAQERLGPFSPPGAPLAPAAPCGRPAQLALHTGTGSNACSMAWSVPGLGHADAPALAVAAELLVQQQLHARVREQGGAYVATAGFSSLPGLFVMRSERDPRLADTFRDFEASVQALADRAASDDALEMAVIGAVKQLDPPATPTADLFQRWALLRAGIDDGMRAAHRRGILDCTPQQVQRAVATWLAPTAAARVAVAGHLAQDLAGLPVVDLVALARELT